MLRKLAVTIVVLVLGVTIGKMCQYAAVDVLEATIGFDASSAVGLAGFLMLYFLARTRVPGLLDWRKLWRP